MFLGITSLAYDLGIVPGGNETVVSQIARRVFGAGFLYYEIQAVTMLILLLAANTSFADFPRLSYFLARDRFIPRQFATQGDRLVFSNGIVILAGLAAVLIVVFQGDTHALCRSTPSASSSPSRSRRRAWCAAGSGCREPGWAWRIWFNVVGALVTGVVLVTLAVTKFLEGAWIVVLLIPLLVVLFLDGAPPLRHGRVAAVAGGHVHAAAARRHRPGAGRRPPSRRGAARCSTRSRCRPTPRRSTSRPIPSGRGGWRSGGASGAWACRWSC